MQIRRPRANRIAVRRCCSLFLCAIVASIALADTGPWVRKIQSPQYIAISVADVDESAAWYRQVLGLNVLDDMTASDGKWRIQNLTNDDFFLEIIWSSEDEDADDARGIVKFGFRVPDVRVVADRVEAATGERPKLLEFAQHEIRLVQLYDPDGNILQLTSPLEESESVD